MAKNSILKKSQAPGLGYKFIYFTIFQIKLHFIDT